MNVNDIVAIVLLFIAVTDTFLAQTLLPKMLRESPGVTPESARRITKFVNAMTFVFFAAGVLVYFWRPL